MVLMESIIDFGIPRERIIEIRAEYGLFCSACSCLIDISLKLISLIMKN